MAQILAAGEHLGDSGEDPDWSSESSSEDLDLDLSGSDASGLMTTVDETSGPVFIGADSARDSQPRAACHGDFQEFRYRASSDSGVPSRFRIPSTVYHSQTADSVCVGPGPGDTTEVAVLSHWAPGVAPHDITGDDCGSIALYRLTEGGGASPSAHNEMELLATADLDFGAHTFARSPCGSFLAVGGDDGLLGVYEVLREGGSVSLEVVVFAELFDVPSHDMWSESLAMNNSVRFCVIKGALRLIVASQNRYVYILNIVTGNRRNDSVRPLYVSLLDSDGKYPWHSPTRPVDPEQHLGSTEQQGLKWWAAPPQSPAESLECLRPGNDEVWRAGNEGTWHRGRTDAIGPFCDPVNCAEVSPDGNWLAAVMDSHSVWVVPLSKRSWGKVKEFSQSPRPLDRLWKPHDSRHEALNFFVRRGSRGSWAPGDEEEVSRDPNVTFDYSGKGCQYCAWNPSSTLLAVSSDSLHVVNVFEVERHGAAVARFPYHETPCLGLSFTPWGDEVVGETLVWAQEHTRLHVALLDDFTRLPSCVDFDPPHRDTYVLDRAAPRALRRINGLGITPGGTVLLGLKDRMVGIKLLRNWSPETHSLFPETFKAAVKAIMLGHAEQREGSVLSSLPTPLLQGIIGRAAFPLAPWVLKGSGWKRLRSGPHGDGQPAYEGETPRRDPELTNRLQLANRRCVAAGKIHNILSFLWPLP